MIHAICELIAEGYDRRATALSEHFVTVFEQVIPERLASFLRNEVAERAQTESQSDGRTAMSWDRLRADEVIDVLHT